MLAVNSLFCFFTSQLIGKINGHFYSFRYVIYIVLFCWIFIVVVYSRVSRISWGALALWTLILCGSGYTITRNYRYNFTPYMAETKAFIEENIQPQDVLVMDLEAWDILYGYYVPGHEWVYYTDLDVREYRGRTIWAFRAVSPFYSKEDCARLKLETNRYYGFGFMGAQRFELEKVYVKP